MSTLTEVLNLFCYDPETDGANTFNIEQALNENWAKIDAAVAKKISREDVPDAVKNAVEDGLLTAGDLGAVSEDMVGVQSGVASLDETGKVPESQLPELDFDTSGSAAAVQANLTTHIANKSNPHAVTAEQVGAYTRSQTLTAGTASLFGLSASAVPDTVFSQIKSLVDAAIANGNIRAVIEFGQYVGTGTDTASITASFPIKFLLLYYGSTYMYLPCNPSMTGAIRYGYSTTYRDVSISWSNGNKTLTITNSWSDFNSSGVIYRYIVMG